MMDDIIDSKAVLFADVPIEDDCGDWLTGILLQNVFERRTLKRTHSKASTYKICRHPLLL